MELVEQDGRLRRSGRGDGAERFPHVHDRQPDAFRLLGAEPIIEGVHAGLRTILSAEPDRPAANQVADHDPVGMPLPDRDFVDPDGLWARRTGTLQLDAHVVLVEFLDRTPVQFQFLGDILDRARPAAAADIPGKPLRIERVVGQKVQVLAPHFAGTGAAQAPHLEFEVDPRVGAGLIASTSCRAVVPARVLSPAVFADRFFERRKRGMTRANGSPKIPRMSSRGSKPGKRYASMRRLRLRSVAMAQSCHVQPRHQPSPSATPCISDLTVMQIYPHYSEKTLFF